MSSNQDPLSDLIQKLMDDGSLSRLYRAGFVSGKALLYFEIYNKVKRRIIKEKYTKANIIFQDVAIEYNVSIQTVYRAYKVFYQKPEKSE
jgi:DNA-binding transcriptional regulator YhcF (GntR family)